MNQHIVQVYQINNNQQLSIARWVDNNSNLKHWSAMIINRDPKVRGGWSADYDGAIEDIGDCPVKIAPKYQVSVKVW